MGKGYNMTEFAVFKKAFIDAGYDVEVSQYGDSAVISIRNLQISFEFESDKLLFINNERYEDY